MKRKVVNDMSHSPISPQNNIRKSKRPHYGWIIAFAGLLITGAGPGILNSSLGVFVRPVCEEFGFLRGQFTLYSTITMLSSVVLMPFFGSLFKRHGFKRVAVVGAVMSCVTLMGYSVSSKLWHFYVFAFMNGLFANGVGMMSIGILINRWFIDKRGLATGIAFSGSGLMAAILLPLANHFIELQGWRWTYRFMGFVSLFILIPVILFVVKNRPEDIELEPYQTDKGVEKGASPLGNAVGFTREEAVRFPSFWFLAVATMGVTLCQAGPHAQAVTFLSDIGYSPAFAAGVSSVYMMLLTGCKVGMGFVLDRLGPLKGSMLIGSCCVLFPIFAMFALLPGMPWVFAVFLAVASSGSTILGALLTMSYFGGRDYARVYSIITMISYIGVSASSPLLGSMYDATGSYTNAWILISCMGALVCFCLFAANKTRVKFEETKL